MICKTDGHIQSTTARDNSRTWFHGMLLKAGAKTTNVLNLGTALHRECLAMELHRTPGWISHVFRSIVHWPDHLPLWHEWEQIYCDTIVLIRNHKLRALPRCKCAAKWTPTEWNCCGRKAGRPLHFDVHATESGYTAFEREKQDTPINPEQCEWPDSYFGDWIWFDNWPADLRLRTLSLDP